MEALLEALGIDWKLLIAQGVNFFILLVALRYFLYKPLVGIMEERRKRIEEGLTDAAKAKTDLERVHVLRSEVISRAEVEAVQLLEKTEKEATKLRLRRAEETDAYILQLMNRAKERVRREHSESEELMEKEAVELIKLAVTKLVSLSPSAIDEKLVKEAAEVMKKSNVLHT